jgi:hypothetical protein
MAPTMPWVRPGAGANLPSVKGKQRGFDDVGL